MGSAAAVAVPARIATCPRCKAQVPVKTMSSLYLLGEPDEKVDVYGWHSHQGMECPGWGKEIDP